ncbi:hypothetical protein [Lacipirellula parvula]|uniref:Uncharacterized protein n=1 Tax=Lacipirellula parvula TaxID=2650471 RepID=A0A5K7XA83_9BACT|nr:hypothetical protein [Lacipirellula parvula]BBO33614.1 hypothetical protein PLANPX_3226 [Lacipirellula parvula]
MLEPKQLALALGEANVTFRDAFNGSLAYLHTGRIRIGYSKVIRVTSTLRSPLTVKGRAFIEVHGDVRAPIVLPDGGLVLIHGNLDAPLKTSGIAEIVVAGRVEPAAEIEASEIVWLFVADDFDGQVSARSMATMCVGGGVTGVIRTGEPSATIAIGGDMCGVILPVGTAGLLRLQVGGFMSAEAISIIDSLRYLEFKALIGSSDQPAGVYPEDADEKSSLKGIVKRRWVVLATA